MTPAAAPRARPRDARLLAVDRRTGAFRDSRLADLPSLLDPGDLLVVNDAGTLPASFAGMLRGSPVELRLSAWRADGAFEAVLFGPGDWRSRTEDRHAPPAVQVGDTIQLSGLTAHVDEQSGPRAIRVHFNLLGDPLVLALLRVGRPVQYAHLRRPLDPWDIQTPWAGRPWSMELPSAAFPWTFGLVAALWAKGIELTPLTHGCGLSSTGDRALDASLPWPERYELPPATTQAIMARKQEGKRVIAVGTSVTRALESATTNGELTPGAGIATLRITPSHPLRVVHGLISGLHDPSESHFDLLGAFLRPDLLKPAWEHASQAGYLSHEYGDLCLIL